MKIGEWVKAARKHGKLTQDAVGELLGRTKGNISGWERGHHRPSFQQMEIISTATGYPLPTKGANAQPPIVATEPRDTDAPPEFVSFNERRVSDSQWCLLQAAELILTDEQKATLLLQARELEARAEAAYAARIASGDVPPKNTQPGGTEK